MLLVGRLSRSVTLPRPGGFAGVHPEEGTSKGSLTESYGQLRSTVGSFLFVDRLGILVRD